MFKKILSIFIVGILSTGLVACGEEKQSTKPDNNKQEVFQNSNIKDNHLNVLESNKKNYNISIFLIE